VLSQPTHEITPLLRSGAMTRSPHDPSLLSCIHSGERIHLPQHPDARGINRG